MIASTSWDGTICVWNMRSGSLHRKLEGHSDLVTSSVWSPSRTGTEYLATASWDKTVRVWNVREGSCVSILHGHYNAICGLLWDVKENILFSAAGDGLLRVWDAKDERQTISLSAESSVMVPQKSKAAVVNKAIRRNLQNLSNDEVCCLLFNLRLDALMKSCRRMQWTGEDLYYCDNIRQVNAMFAVRNSEATLLLSKLQRFKLSGVPPALLVQNELYTQCVAVDFEGIYHREI